MVISDQMLESPSLLQHLNIFQIKKYKSRNMSTFLLFKNSVKLFEKKWIRGL